MQTLWHLLPGGADTEAWQLDAWPQLNGGDDALPAARSPPSKPPDGGKLRYPSPIEGEGGDYLSR